MQECAASVLTVRAHKVYIAVGHVALQKYLSVAMKRTESGLELVCLGVSNRKGKENLFSTGTVLTEFTTMCMTKV